jgi:predicted nucleic acid-binding protein
MRLLQEPPDFMETLDAYLQLPRVRGPIVHDARIAALCAAHGVTELLTKDRDFQLFAGLRTRDPFG